MPGPLGTSSNSPSIDKGTLARVEHKAPSGRPGSAVAQAKVEKSLDGVSHVVVKPGDTLWSICAQKMQDPSLYMDLARLNGVSFKAVLQIGQKLIVPDFQRSDWTTAYILSEMITNAQSQEASDIAAAIARSRSFQAEGDKSLADMKKARWYELFRVYSDQEVFNAMAQQSGFAMAEAKARWFLQVRTDGPWDHKPILRRKYESMPTPPRPFGLKGRAFHFPIRGDLFHEFYYDIWSNIHFGYVGSRCGFEEKVLQAGAASGFPGAGGNDEGDVISTNIGVALWKKVGLSLTEKALRGAILARTNDYLAARAREIAGGVAPDKATNVVITDNDYK